MCDRIILLARIDHRRWISCCEHGSAHITWDNLSMRVPLSRLSVLSDTLQECAQVSRRFRIASSGEVCVIFDQFDLYQVWFSGVGLCLSPSDFQLFCDIIGEAGNHPMARNCADEAGLSPVDSGADSATYTSLGSSIRTPYHLFSQN